MSKLLKPYRLIEYSIYTFYNAQKVPKNHKIKKRQDFLDVVKKIGEHIGTNLAEKKGGVLIKGLGYFFVWKIPRKMVHKRATRGKELEEFFNYHTEHHMYSPIFLPHTGKNNLRGWSMDNKFCANVRRAISRKLKTGFRYKMYAYSIRTLNK